MVKLDHISPEDTEIFIEEYRKQVKSTKAADLVNDIMGKLSSEGAQTPETAEAEKKEKKGKKTIYEGMIADLDRIEARLKKKPLRDRTQKDEMVRKLKTVLSLLEQEG